MDYLSDMPDDSFFSGEANEQYINDEKKPFSITSEEELTGIDSIKKNLLSKNNFLIGVIKKTDFILLNNDKFKKDDSDEIMVLPLVGWEENDDGEISHWKFKVSMNNSWYLDGCVDLEVDSPQLISMKALTFDMF